MGDWNDWLNKEKENIYGKIVSAVEDPRDGGRRARVERLSTKTLEIPLFYFFVVPLSFYFQIIRERLFYTTHATQHCVLDHGYVHVYNDIAPNNCNEHCYS